MKHVSSQPKVSKGEQVAEVMALRVMYVEDDCIRLAEDVFRPPTEAIMLFGRLVASHYHLEISFGRNKSNPEHHNLSATPHWGGFHTDNLQYIIPLKSFGFVENFSTLISPTHHPHEATPKPDSICEYSQRFNKQCWNWVIFVWHKHSRFLIFFIDVLVFALISLASPESRSCRGLDDNQLCKVRTTTPTERNVKLICYHHSINLPFFNRESVIDFSKPFMNLGISILFKVRCLAAIVSVLTHEPRHIRLSQGGFVTNNVYLTFTFRDLRQRRRRRAVTWNKLVSHLQVPETQETKLFSFLNPLAFEIWIFVFFAYCLVICLCASENLFFTPYRFSFRPLFRCRSPCG